MSETARQFCHKTTQVREKKSFQGYFELTLGRCLAINNLF